MNEIARYRRSLAGLYRVFGATVDVYASGTVNSSGSAGAMVQVGTAVPLVIVPATQAGGVAPAPPLLAGGRAEYVGIDPGTAAIGMGCELRNSGGTYIVEGTADWKLSRVLQLSKVTTPYH